MRAALRSRVERLEVKVEPKKPPLFRSGYLKTLPADYVGERHVVILSGEGKRVGSPYGCSVPRPSSTLRVPVGCMHAKCMRKMYPSRIILCRRMGYRAG